MFVSLALLNKNKLLGLVFLVLAIFVGVARVYLGQHFYGDVYAGAMIGTLSAFLIYIVLIQSRWYRKWWTRKSVTTVFKKH
jgi:membrane-associated phospholipid phosphatase